MPNTATDTQALKLHVDHGFVWYLDGAGHPRSSGKTAVEFLDDAVCRNAECVRLIGNPANASLIVELYNQCLRRQLACVEVVTPLVCATERERGSPEACLHYMRRFSRAPSQGGFHKVTERDYPAYALAAEVERLRREHKPCSDMALRYLEAHPAWRPLSFVRHLDPAKMAQLLGVIIDPRWYFDPCKPDRSAKLEAWLGLNPKTQEGVTRNAARKWRHHNRCLLMRQCWKRADLVDRARAVMRTRGIEPPYEGDEVTRAPGDFLWRVWGRWAETGDPVKADLRASQKLLRFLRLAWLGELYRGTGQFGGGLSLFRPVDFFRYVVEAEAFERHMKALK